MTLLKKLWAKIVQVFKQDAAVVKDITEVPELVKETAEGKMN